MFGSEGLFNIYIICHLSPLHRLRDGNFFRARIPDSCGLLPTEEAFDAMESNELTSFDVSQLPKGTAALNRYVNVLPNPQTRVRLDPIPGLPADFAELSGYINANHVRGADGKRKYIATQGPKAATTDAFWRMVWEQNVGTVVMAAEVKEMGRDKCYQYWPEGTGAGQTTSRLCSLLGFVSSLRLFLQGAAELSPSPIEQQ